MSTHDDRMVSRIPAAVRAPYREPGQAMPPFLIVIPAADGTELLRMTEDAQGRLSVTGDESRWDEGARRFIDAMMQWSGVVGVRWKDEAVRAAEGKLPVDLARKAVLSCGCRLLS